MTLAHHMLALLFLLTTSACGIMTPIESPSCEDLPQTCVCPDDTMGQTTCDEETLTITGCDCDDNT